jgi:hypothetical protein
LIIEYIEFIFKLEFEFELKVKMAWASAVLKACLHESDNRVVTRKNLIANQMQNIIRETGSCGKTPQQTLSRVLQDWRDLGVLKFTRAGVYEICAVDISLNNPKRSRGELMVETVLRSCGIEFEREKKFHDLAHIRQLRFDVYFEHGGRGFCVEFDGIQHKRPVAHFGGEVAFESLCLRDALKNNYVMGKTDLHLIRLHDLKTLQHDLCEIIETIKSGCELPKIITPTSKQNL